MARMKTRARLELRGAWAPGYESTLSGVARQAGVADRLRVHQQALPDDMVALAAQHHLGLSVELADTRNHALCLGNKIFTYLLAGVPVLLSDTPAQCELANQLGKAAAVVSLADPPAIAYLLDEWLGDPRLLESARRTARAIADTRFNWDVEKRAFLASVKEVL
jgi:glycosyltransferase involved in cell wall biosynthesis